MNLDRAFTPQWAGAWTWTRIWVGITCLIVHGSRLFAIPDAYASPDMVFVRYPFYLAHFAILSPPTAQLVWLAGVVGALMLLWGGRLAKPGLALFLIGSWTLLSAEALNIKAYDRLLTWICLGLFLAPISERDLHQKARSPVARWWLLITFVAIYGSTGSLKLLADPGWFDGRVLAYHLVQPWFGGHALGVWLSDQSWFTLSASWFTLAFECSFPFLVLWRRSNPWILASGVLFHLGILALMDVGPFSLVAVSAYPALLHPEVARDLEGHLRALVARSSG